MTTPSACRRVRVTAGVVIRADGRILAARRPEGDRLAGLWEFPGGKLEPGETPEGCLKRELLEELGLEVRVERLLTTVVHDYPELTVELLVHLCRTEGEPNRLEAHSETRWLRSSELGTLEWAPADLPVLPLLTGCSI